MGKGHIIGATGEAKRDLVFSRVPIQVYNVTDWMFASIGLREIGDRVRVFRVGDFERHGRWSGTAQCILLSIFLGQRQKSVTQENSPRIRRPQRLCGSKYLEQRTPGWRIDERSHKTAREIDFDKLCGSPGVLWSDHPFVHRIHLQILVSKTRLVLSPLSRNVRHWRDGDQELLIRRERQDG